MPPRGLIYVTDEEPGWSRKGAGTGFFFIDEKGNRIADRTHINRIKELVIPPAWQNVWIAPQANAHIQATGRDQKGRKQYIYHATYRAHRERVKYDALEEFGRLLPRLRRAVRRDINRKDLDKQKMAALVVRLIDRTRMRVGTDEYAEANKTFGATTLRDEHVNVSGRDVSFCFVGKSGKERQLSFTDKRLARLLSRLQELPGQRLFQYRLPSGTLSPLTSDDINGYLTDLCSDVAENISAKTFRTWWGSVLAHDLFQHEWPEEKEHARTRQIASCVKEVASQLGNTPAVARSSYIHPRIISDFERAKLKPIAITSGVPEMRQSELSFLERLKGWAGRARQRAA